MGAIEAVHLRAGPCDGERSAPLPGTGFPDRLEAITVMDHTARVRCVYGATPETVRDEHGVVRTVFAYERTVEGDAVEEGGQPGPPAQ